MKLIHLSDIHLTIPGEPMAGLDPHARLAQALAHINIHHPNAARIIITGDLCHWGEADAYAALADALKAQTIPVRLLIGNHDDRNTFLTVFPDHPHDAQGYINYAETLDDVRLIYLDTTSPRTHAGHFGPDRCAWLEDELNNAKRVRIFMHHNPLVLGLPAVDKIGLNLRDRSLFKAVIDGCRDKIDHIHFGHVHMPIHGRFCGIPYACVPSLGMQAIPDMNEAVLLKSGPMPPAYYVVNTDGPDTTIVSVPFDWDGPVNCTGTAWEDWAKPAVTG